MSKVNVYTASQFLATATHGDGLQLVHFASPLFSGCKYLSRLLEELAGQLEGLLDINEVAMDLQNTDLIQSYRIEQLPTLILFDRGAEAERLEELLSPQALDGFLRDCISFYLPDRGRPAVGPESSDPEGET